MKDSLVDRLRRQSKKNFTQGGLLVMVTPGLLNEAADEIERLLNTEYQRGWNAGYGEANREWQTSR